MKHAVCAELAANKHLSSLDSSSLSFIVFPYRFTLCNIYLPGDIEINRFQEFTENLIGKFINNPEDRFVILGDFNVPNFSSPFIKCTKAKGLMEIMETCAMEQFGHIRSQKSGSNLLDLVFSNDFLFVEACEDPLVKIDEFHPPMIVTVKLKLTSRPEENFSYRNWKKVLWRRLNTNLSSINWHEVFAFDQSSDEMVEDFYKVIYDILNVHCPMITVKKKKPSHRNLSRESLKLLNEKRRYHSKWKKHGNPIDYQSFKNLRQQTSASVAIDMQKALSRTEEDIKQNPKNFWKFVNSKKSNGVGVAEYVKLDTKIAHSKNDAVELFAEYFQSVYEKSDDDFTPIQSTNSSTWSSLSISMDKIQVKLKACA